MLLNPECQGQTKIVSGSKHGRVMEKDWQLDFKFFISKTFLFYFDCSPFSHIGNAVIFSVTFSLFM